MRSFAVGFCIGIMVKIITTVLINDNGPRWGV